jgi:hypothetical protein
MSLQILRLPNSENAAIVKGSTWGGVTITLERQLTTTTTEPINITGAVISLTLKQGTKTSTLTTSVIDGLNGVLRINSISRLDLNRGLWSGGLIVLMPNGDLFTYCIVEIEVSEV